MQRVQRAEFLSFALSLSPEQREILRSALADSWDEGYDWCYDDGGVEMNPYVHGNPFVDTREV